VNHPGLEITFENVKLTQTLHTELVDCILEAVLTVSPKKQYLGTLIPTTPATTGPECTPKFCKLKN